MPKKKETVIIEEKVEQTIDSPLAKIIEIYKIQNPEKYELKKAELEAKLNK